MKLEVLMREAGIEPKTARLGVRTGTWKQELRSLELPSDVNGLLTQLFQLVTSDRETRYLSAFIMTYIEETPERKDDVLSVFGVTEISQVWARLNWFDGAELARWQIVTKLFNRETCLALGERALYQMTTIVTSELEEDSPYAASCKIAYGQIFSAFKRSKSPDFRTVINQWVSQRRSSRARPRTPVVSSETRRTPLFSKRQAVNPTPSEGFKLTVATSRQSECSQCKAKDTVIVALTNWVYYLEGLLSRTALANALRKGRPTFLKKIKF
ncbi:MAG TPA: hypothetical protein VEA59_04610 [Patescibacteria group bacterium]|nr:hypothetical protein [Patescibacteria group bacterium]